MARESKAIVGPHTVTSRMQAGEQGRMRGERERHLRNGGRKPRGALSEAIERRRQAQP